MENAFEIIVVILSAVLFVFLVIAIVATVYVVKLVKALRALAERGEVLVEKVESVGDTIRENASAVGLLRIVTSAVRMISKAKRGL